MWLCRLIEELYSMRSYPNSEMVKRPAKPYFQIRSRVAAQTLYSRRSVIPPELRKGEYFPQRCES